MRKFKSIKIIHNIVRRADYVFLSEFFRFIGIFVCEGILIEKPNDRTRAEKNTRYDACIYVGQMEVPENDDSLLSKIVDREEYKELIKNLPPDTIYFSSYYDKATDISAVMRESVEKQVEVLESVLNAVLTCIFQKVEREIFDFNSLIKIYVENHIALHSINLQYFQKKPSIAVEKAEVSFINAHKELYKLYEKKKYKEEMDSYCKYAILWTEVKVNLANSYEEKRVSFPINDLAEKCYNLCEEYPDFVNARVLHGICYEPFKNRANDALAVFRSVLDLIDDECFSAPVYYWMGRRYEDGSRNTRTEEQMKTCYTRANKKKVKFRNLFKLAVIARNEKDYENALELFDEIIERLETKSAIDFKDPLEIEYEFKVYNQQCYIYYQQREYTKVIKLGEKALEMIQDDSIDKNRYFKILYGDVASDYRKILKKRLNLSTLHRLLEESFRRIGLVEKANEYLKRMKENES